VLVIVVAAVGVAAVGALGVRAAHDLGRSADRTATQRQALRHYESAMYSRSGIDSGILKAAGAGADPLTVAAEAAGLGQQVDDELDLARALIVEGRATDALLESFDAMSLAMKIYIDDAITLTEILGANPASVPAHLVQMGAAAQELEQKQFEFGAQVIATTDTTRPATRAATRPSCARTVCRRSGRSSVTQATARTWRICGS